MSFNQLDNCPKCGKLFVRGIQDVCNDCYQIEEEEYRKVANYLRKKENRSATIFETSEATGVSIKQIRKFIRQRRISMEGLPNMGYPCEQCGTIIREGALCPSCQQGLSRKITNFLHEEAKRAEEQKYQIKEYGYRHVKDSKKSRRGFKQ